MVGGFDLSTPLMNGWMGVDLFFVLSGFLISSHLLRAQATLTTPSGYVTYLKRRAWRILPAYLTVVWLVVAGVVPYYEPTNPVPARSVPQHLLFLQDLGSTDLVPSLWSLGVEEKFYLLAPVIVMAVMGLGRRKRLVALGALALTPLAIRAAILIGSGPATDYVSWFERFRSPAYVTFEGMALGMLLAVVMADEVWKSKLRQHRQAIGCVGLGSLGLLLVGSPWLAKIDVGDHLWLQTAVAWSSAAVVASALTGGPGTRSLSVKWWYPVAVLSYSAYLVHQLVIPGAMRLNPVADSSGPIAFGGFLSIYLGLTAVGTLGLYLLVEQPALQRRDR